MYMLYQQYTTAIKEAYKGHPDLARQAEQARICREWLMSLEIAPGLRDRLVEPVLVIEDAFMDLLLE